MTRVWPLLVALSKDWLRNREAVFFAFLFPVILLLTFSAVFGAGPSEFTLYVQNNDRGPDGTPTNLSISFTDALEDVEALRIRSIKPGRNITEWSRQRGSAGAARVVIIPDGFADQVRAGSRQARRSVILDTMSRAGGQINQTNRARIRQGANARGRSRSRRATTSATRTTTSWRFSPAVTTASPSAASSTSVSPRTRTPR